MRVALPVDQTKDGLECARVASPPPCYPCERFCTEFACDAVMFCQLEQQNGTTLGFPDIGGICPHYEREPGHDAAELLNGD